MYKVITTWTGPADKVLVNGDHFRYQFLDKVLDDAWLATAPGRLAPTTTDISIPGKVIRTVHFDTEANANANVALERPQQNFKGNTGVERHNNMLTNYYWREINGITCTSEVIPA